ncbi:gliding motility-associated C-terminal domain-containing protein [Flavobacterium sp. Fl-77]|uniref:Gliding motility-associated C-terminal domain-containing protein n=1 Tax=Flavobacterium flavipigmentatum TaxID=2893884 RepID=A0AAJ2S7T1_9FLAO|nr:MULTISPECIES: gliding motility-associated C-terminal domain-containing protein [unclassified Flavobacterium]MDX6181879.1 gliding motility-associated C-terminal domain-containing protein [Flavobacterium sp. Fl-33]MDX6185087.1 gliding motility-associated C-terminal domain-containing protein [Flavobacterium sp. Fl-77]UFH37196.1 gliding motility-associated C-terminal domain-containing protein [Flavobacterium sp. F-70]
MIKKYINFLHISFFFAFLFVFPQNITAQCAGNDTSITICDISDPVNKSISLFSLLGGTPTPGGTWTDDSLSRGLNPSTGVLNGHVIRRGGTFQYTYTAPSTSGCTDNTSTVTITIGAYPGVPAPYATVCNDSEVFSLFTAFNSTVMVPHSNGIWTNSAGQVVPSVIPISGISGDFEFTYTVPVVAACPTNPTSIKVIVSIFRAPKSGTTNDLLLCGSNGLSAYSNYDLNNLISGQDSTGQWSGPGITSGTDHNVDLESLYNANGPGDYSYAYTAVSVPSNNICPDKTSSLTITIEKSLDFTGARLVVSSDICENEISAATYSGRITQGVEAIPNGEYKVTFNVSGPNGGTQTVTANFVNGVISFPIASTYFRQVGTFNVNIINIVATASKGACFNTINNLADDLNVYTLPYLDGAVIIPTTTCQNKSSLVLLSNASRLADGSYTIVYNVTGDNFALGQTAIINVVGGNSSFVIPASLNSNSGGSIITITNITNNTTLCTNIANIKGNLIINPLPNAAAVRIVVNDVCFNDPVTASVSGLGNLTNVTFSYVLSGSNSSILQTVTLPVVNGKIDFIIPSNLLVNTGATVILGTNLINNITSCDVNLNNVFDSFLINPIPIAPTATNSQVFCKLDGATIANLSPSGAQYKWYNSDTSTTALADTYVLKSENYYLRETSLANCTSPATMITVVVNDTPAPVLNPDGQNFCGLANPKISDLSNNTNVPSTVVWYDARNNGNLLASTSLLTDKATYYGIDFSTITTCISENTLEVTVSLFDCDTSQYAFFIPDGFSPNGDNVNDTFTIPDINYLYPDYSIEIFNRYGNVLFKGNKNKPDWDGKNDEASGFGNGIVPNGVYFYIVNFNKDNRRPQQGRVYLNR